MTKSCFVLSLFLILLVGVSVVVTAETATTERVVTETTKSEAAEEAKDAQNATEDEGAGSAASIVEMDGLGNMGRVFECVDAHDQCGTWSSLGECERNPSFMLQTCSKSCGICDANNKGCLDKNPSCQGWTEAGECEKNPMYMHQECPKSCGKCEGDPKPAVDFTKECKDRNVQCPQWSDKGECEKNASYMTHMCCASCSAEAVPQEQDKPAADKGKSKEPLYLYVPEGDECVDKHEHCEYWLEQDECVENPHYMAEHCPKICDFCGKKVELIKTYEDNQRDAYGIMQTIMPDKIEQIHQILKEMQTYVDGIREEAKGSPPEIIEAMEEDCQNKHAQCAFWATLGECIKNPTYMKIMCGPVCRSCDHIGMLTRCPLDPEEPNAWEAGDLNAFFFNLTTNEAYQQYEPKVLSRPSYLRGDNIKNADYKIGPWIVTLENFLSQDEADRMIELGGYLGYERSADTGKINLDGTFGKFVNDGRTSTNAWCLEDCYRDPVSQAVMARIENITNIPTINQEYLQLLRYEPGQYYRTHHDYVENQVNRQSGVRMLTVFLYLNDVTEGGATNFPMIDITVVPKRGRVLVWPSVSDDDPDVIDIRTRHQALEVEKGIKYAANAWIHRRDYQGPHQNGCQ